MKCTRKFRPIRFIWNAGIIGQVFLIRREVKGNIKEVIGRILVDLCVYASNVATR
mgnify:CR=1 FL=1